MNVFDTLFMNETRIQVAAFLTSEFAIGLDWWNIIHIISGFILMAYFIKQKTKNPWSLIFFILLVFEIIEFYFFTTNNRFFIAETLTNQIWDIFIGLLGSWIAWIFLRK